MYQKLVVTTLTCSLLALGAGRAPAAVEVGEPKATSIAITRIVTPVLGPATPDGYPGPTWARIKLVFDVPEGAYFRVEAGGFTNHNRLGTQVAHMQYQGIDCTHARSGTTVTASCPVRFAWHYSPGYYRSDETVYVEYDLPNDGWDTISRNLELPSRPGGYLRSATRTKLDATRIATTDGPKVQLTGSLRRWIYMDAAAEMRWRPFRDQTVRFFFVRSGTTKRVYVGVRKTSDTGAFVARFAPRGKGTWIARSSATPKFAASRGVDKIG